MPRTRPLRVGLVGDVGGAWTFHVGDEAMLAADLALVRRLLPDSDCFVVSKDPAHTSAFHVVEAVGIDDASAATVRAQLLVIAGGGNLNSSFPDLLNARVELARGVADRGGTVVLLGQMLGPYLTERDADDLSALLDVASFVSVRDGASAEVARRLGVADSDLRVHVDDAWRIGEGVVPDADLGRSPHIAVTVHPDARLVPPVAINSLAGQLTALATDVGATVLLLPHCRAPVGPNGTSDEAVEAALAERLDAAGVAHRSFSVLDPPTVAAITRASDLVVSTRYHPIVFATSGCVPSVAVWADEYVHSKQRGALAPGLEEWSLSVDDALGGALLDAALEAWQRRDDLARWLADSHGALTATLDERDHDVATRLVDVGIDAVVPETPTPAEPLPDVAGAPLPAGRWSRLRAPAPGTRRTTTVVDRLRVETSADGVALVARVRGRDLEPMDVHLRVHDATISDRLDASATPFCSMAVLLSAATDTDLVIESPVDAGLLARVGELAALCHTWWGWSEPAVDAPAVTRDHEPGRAVGCWHGAAPGGLASDVTHLLTLDPGVEAPPGVTRLRCSTDADRVFEPSLPWSRACGAVLAGIGLVAGPLLGTVVLPPSTGDGGSPGGCDPELVPLLGTTTTQMAASVTRR